MLGMGDNEFEAFLERISAVAIVNQAAIKCLSMGIPLNPENVEFLVGDFFDPNRPEMIGMVDRIREAIEELRSPMALLLS